MGSVLHTRSLPFCCRFAAWRELIRMPVLSLGMVLQMEPKMIFNECFYTLLVSVAALVSFKVAHSTE
jgi:hypothetical protein